MKAVVVYECGGPEVLQYKDVPDLKVNAGQVLINVKAIGINPVETYLRAGTFYKPNLPITLGTDASGVVEQIGDGVVNVKPGDRVFITGSLSGTYAEQTLALEKNVFKLPDNASFADGASLGVAYGTAARSLLYVANANAYETVLVHGATGGVGTAAIQIAKSLGMRVYGTGGSHEGLELIKKQGALEAFDHHKANYLDEIVQATKKEGLHLILEMLANVNLQNDLNLISPRGKIVIIGCRGKVEIDPRSTMGKDLKVLGMRLTNASEQEYLGIYRFLSAALENKIIHPIIRKEFSLKDIQEAHRLLMEPGAYGKIILIP